MATNPGYVKPGEVRNPNGRPPGSKNKIGRDFHDAYEQAKTQEDTNIPILLIAMEWAHDESKPLEVRAAMIKEASSYTCTKPKITVRSEVPVLTSIDQAESFLATVAAENDLDPIELMTAVRHWIDSRRAGQELQLKLADGNIVNQTIRIEGGLPPLPGADVIMPPVNDHNDHLIDLEKNAGSTETTLPAPDAGRLTATGRGPTTMRDATPQTPAKMGYSGVFAPDICYTAKKQNLRA